MSQHSRTEALRIDLHDVLHIGKAAVGERANNNVLQDQLRGLDKTLSGLGGLFERLGSLVEVHHILDLMTVLWVAMLTSTARSCLVCLVTHPIWPTNAVKLLIALAFGGALVTPRRYLERSIVVYVFKSHQN